MSTPGTATSIRWATKAAQRGYTVAQNIVLFDQRLSPTARLLYIQLSHYAWRNPDDYPTQEEIGANAGGVADRQVRRYIAELELRGLVRRRQRGLGRSVEYTLYEPSPTYLDDDDPQPGENAGETAVDDPPSPDIHDRASPDTDDRQARTPTTGALDEGREDLPEQEKVRRLVVGRRVTRERALDVGDAVENSLRRGGALS